MRPVTRRVVHHAQRIYGVGGVRFGVWHEQAGLSQSTAEIVHFRVDEQRKQVLHRNVVLSVFNAQCFREAFDVRLQIIDIRHIKIQAIEVVAQFTENTIFSRFFVTQLGRHTA